MPDNPDPDEPVVHGGGSRPNIQLQRLCQLAGLGSKSNVETGETERWVLKDLRKTCATCYDEHVPESSIEILGHSVGGITYRHYAHRAPLAFKAILILPQPSAFWSLVKGFDGECPCCRRRFTDAPEPRAMCAEIGAQTLLCLPIGRPWTVTGLKQTDGKVQVTGS
jgi:hypothetical protein